MTSNKIAIHEAGHAVLGVYLGIKIREITIIPNPAKGSYGDCEFAPAKLRAERRAILYLGGIAAQRLHGCEDENYQDQDDYVSAFEVMLKAYQKGKKNEDGDANQATHKNLANLLEAAVKLLTMDAQAHAALADKLSVDLKMSGQDAMTLIKKHLGNESADHLPQRPEDQT